VAGTRNQRPNVVGDWPGSSRIQHLNPTAFAAPATRTFGNLGAYALCYPFFDNRDRAFRSVSG
jgi:hypothetical protein